MEKVLITTAFLVCVILWTGDSRAEEIKLEKIVVTPYRYSESILKTAAGVSVISQNEISNSCASSIVDLLRSVPGLVVRDWYGNASKVSVDMRGFGEQGNLNVLVMVDGRRVNEVDLSGVSWTQVPLDQVEKIEIIHGGTVAVLYGDNAVSGVINIITKNGKGTPKLSFESGYGSYDANSQRLSYGGQNKNLSYLFTLGREGTHGYRNNSFYKSQDFSSKLNYVFPEERMLRFSSGYHRASYGLPASLKEAVIGQFSRRYARKSDYADEEDYYLLVGGKKEFFNFGCFDADISYRLREVKSYFPTDKLYTLRSKINTIGFTPKYTLERNMFNLKNKFISGFDFYHSDYSANSYDATSDELKVYTDTNRISLAGYLHNELALLKKLLLVSGYRQEWAKFEFDYHDLTGWNPDIDKNIRPNEEAFNTGLIYEYAKNSSLFFALNRSFRFPEVDEFTYNDASWQQQLNTDLKPQGSLNFEAGIKHAVSENVQINLSVFRMQVKNELYYNSTGGPIGYGQNQNYDKTVHEGIELDFESSWKEKLSIFGNYAFTKAFFDGNEYNKNEIPMVPQHQASLGLRIPLPRETTLNLIGNYVGKRYFLNDQANAFSRLNGYFVMDMNIVYKLKDFSAAFSINNVGNKKCAQYAGVDHTDNEKFYYPSPERNFNIKLEYIF